MSYLFNLIISLLGWILIERYSPSLNPGSLSHFLASLISGTSHIGYNF